MNIDNHNNMMSAALRCGVSLMMLSGVCAPGAYAQEPADSTSVNKPGKATTAKAKLPVSMMPQHASLFLGCVCKRSTIATIRP